MRLTEQEIAAIDQKVKDGTHALVLLELSGDRFSGVYTTVAKLLLAAKLPIKWQGRALKNVGLAMPDAGDLLVDNSKVYPLVFTTGSLEVYSAMYACLCPLDTLV